MELQFAPSIDYLNERLSRGQKERKVCVTHNGIKMRGLHPIGTVLFFEYHCWENHSSADAELWYHSHQPVTVLKVADCDPPFYTTIRERAENANLLMYRVKFGDGYEQDVFEDELLMSPMDYQRPDPPGFCSHPQNGVHGKVLVTV